jgi:hypothetical protein
MQKLRIITSKSKRFIDQLFKAFNDHIENNFAISVAGMGIKA